MKQLHLTKKAIRALGIAESFRVTDKKSTLAGVVMRSDLVIDGFIFGRAAIGGDDATSEILKAYRALDRGDINILLLSGCIISLYNIIDVDELADEVDVPVICLTYRESRGIEGAIRKHFEGDNETIRRKLGRYRRLGGRIPITLQTGSRSYARCSGISATDAKTVLDAFTLQGGVPEPIRVARLLAHVKNVRSVA